MWKIGNRTWTGIIATISIIIGLYREEIRISLAEMTQLQPSNFDPFVIGAIAGMIFATAIYVWGALVYLRQKRMKVDPTYIHLTVHYSQRPTDMDNPARPYYVINNNTKKAYWVFDWLQALVKKRIVKNVTHDGATALLKHLENENIEVNNRYPLSLGELSLQEGKGKPNSVLKLNQVDDLIKRLTNFIYDPIPTLVTETNFINFRAVYDNLMTEAEGYIGHEAVNNHTHSLNHTETATFDSRKEMGLAKKSSTEILNMLKKYKENLE